MRLIIDIFEFMKTWFITGISRGLCLALAKAALAEGYTVIGTVRSGTPDTATGSGILRVLTLDLADGAAAEAAVEQAFALVGKIDVIVNNAGYGLLGAIEKASDAEVMRLFNAQIRSIYRNSSVAMRSKTPV
jgi:NAD(P)-dependent dehydrogenase (short-subunit alcohol dehydrogenase family)